MKKSLVIVGLIFLIFVVVGIIIFLWLGGRSNNLSPSAGPASFPSSITQVDSDTILFPSISADSQTLYYYNPDETALYSLNLETAEKNKLADLDDVTEVLWSHDQKQVGVKVVYHHALLSAKNSLFLITDASPPPDGSLIYWLYDFEKSQWSKLSDRIQKIAWSPAENKIVYSLYSPEKETNEIKLIDLNNHQVQTILLDPTESNFAEAEFAGKNRIYLLPYPTEESGDNLTVYDLEKQTSRVVVDDQSVILPVKASPTGKLLAFQKFEEGQTGGLGVVKTDGTNEIKKIQIPSGEIKEIAWSNDEKSVFVAQAREEEDDRFYQIEIDSQKITEIRYQAPQDGLKGSQDLFLSPDDTALFFQSSNRLFRMDLD